MPVLVICLSDECFVPFGSALACVPNPLHVLSWKGSQRRQTCMSVEDCVCSVRTWSEGALFYRKDSFDTFFVIFRYHGAGFKCVNKLGRVPWECNIITKLRRGCRVRMLFTREHFGLAFRKTQGKLLFRVLSCV